MNTAELDILLDKWIHEHLNDLKADLGQLISVPSIAGEAEDDAPYGRASLKALKTAGEIIEKKGFPVTYYDNCALSADCGKGEPVLAMLAHVDVVAPGDGWTSDPFTMTECNGALYGRGTSDDKGPAMAALYAMQAAAEINPDMKSCRIILGSAEETGMNDLAHYEAKEKYPSMVFSPDADYPLINTEKGRFNPYFKAYWPESQLLPRLVSLKGGEAPNIVPHKAQAIIQGVSPDVCKAVCDSIKEGKITCEETKDGVLLSSFGKAAHGSTPEAGLNAITLLIQAVLQLPLAECEGLYRLRQLSRLIPHGDTSGKAIGLFCADLLSGPLSLNLGQLSYTLTGMEGNADLRTPVCADELPLAAMTHAAFGKAGIFCDTSFLMKSHHVPADSELVRTLLKHYHETTGDDGDAFAIGGLTYVHDIPGGVAFGCTMPGHEANIHGANEHITIKELTDSIKIFAKILLELCAN